MRKLIYRRKKHMEKAANELARLLQGKVLYRVLMKRYTSFKIGGLAEVMVFPETITDLKTTVEFCQNKGIPWRVIGKGTNLLVKDGGIEEIIINMSNTFQQVELIDDLAIRAGAGLRLARLVKFCQVSGLEGMEFAAGIPGTVGGAIVMNAGADGKEIADVISKASIYKYKEGISGIERKNMKFSYRHMEKPDSAIFLEAEFSLKKGDPIEIRERIVEGLRKRRNSQPLSMPSAGSIFKNPPDDYAGRLIDKAGLKSMRIGDAQVSETHANFIVNRGRARARDVIELIESIRKEIKKQSGVKLELEVEIIGRD
jgi:UDP-N-acetylmuramate dehydrogenase